MRAASNLSNKLEVNIHPRLRPMNCYRWTHPPKLQHLLHILPSLQDEQKEEKNYDYTYN